MAEIQKLRLGTRGSALARAQSAAFARELQARNPGLEIEFVFIKTSGDRFSAAVNRGETPPEDLAQGGAPNVKAMFVKEIEVALADGRIDIAVHSSKDLPAELAPGMVLGAYPEREDPRDVFIGTGCARWQELPEGSLVGTASLRRSIQLARHRPDLMFRELRGNVDTRLRKLREGEAAGIILAKAGLKRLGRTEIPHQDIEPEHVIPAPGQGALAIEARGDDGRTLELLSTIDHGPTRTAVELEREMLRRIGGGCSTPLGAYAGADGQGFSMRVFWSDPDGRRPAVFSARAADTPEGLRELADGLYEKVRQAQNTA